MSHTICHVPRRNRRAKFDFDVVNTGGLRTPKIWIDGDGCPVVLDTRRIAARHGVPVTLVRGPSQRPSEASEGFEEICVSRASEAADDTIASRVGPGEVVVTDDLLLADRCLKAGATVLSSRGTLFSEENIGSKLAQRDIGKFLRELGQPTGGPAAFSESSRSRFKMTLHEVLEKLKRQYHRKG